MKSIVVVGAGNIGGAITQFLTRTGDYGVRLIDHRREQLETVAGCEEAERLVVDVADPNALRQAFHGCWAVLSAAPYHLTIPVAEAAMNVGAHYFDLTEDVASTRAVKALSAGAGTVFAPQCGLAPGFVTIAAHDLCAGFDSLDEVRLRVGALPQFPTGALGYNLTWSTDGVINEYLEPCEAIVDGVLRETTPLEECETFSLDGIAYEAFNTSGGLGSLCETLAGRVRALNYRTIRYPGHAAVMKTLVNDLGLRRRRDILKDVLEAGLPATLQDIVLVVVTVCGHKAGRFVQETSVRKIYADMIGGTQRSAIQISTAAGICAVVDLVAEGSLKSAGLLRQEEIPLAMFLNNRFGRAYDVGAAALDGLSRPLAAPVRERVLA
jgi:saccharopine dehydrogenase-like NADP-dependent oxidoreductase